MNPRIRHSFLFFLAFFVALLLGCTAGKVVRQPETKPVVAKPAPLDTAYTRSVPATENRGMVVAAHPLASQVGRDILQSGGNAIDAAVATLGALNVVEPHASGLGGGGFALYFDAAKDSFYVIDYRERAPEIMQRAIYFNKSDTLKLVQRSGATSVLTPGAAAGWQMMHTRWGTKLLRDVFAPAVALADTGYTVSEKQSAMILDHLPDLQSDSGMASVFLSDSLPLMAGMKLKQPRLAQTLRFLSKTRLENFYYPPYSNDVAQTVHKRGGFIATKDLSSYRAQERKPLRGSYHGYEIITLPPPASGGACLLELLKLVEPFDLPAMGFLSADYIHTIASATRQAMKDADTWVADPDFARVPVNALLSDAWIDTARTRMRSDSAADKITALDSIRAFGPGNTTHLVVVDSAGNIASVTQSINYFFGAGVMVPELGLLLNNHMGDFAADTTSRRGIAPLHRPPSNMAATIVRKNGKPVLVIGSPGGPRIAPAIAQVLIALLDFGKPLNEALDAPRFFPAGKTLVAETRIPKTMLDALSKKGWRIYLNGAANNYFGGVNAIQIDSETHQLIGGSDPRRDGAPAGY